MNTFTKFKHVTLIGCGGIGSYLAPILARMAAHSILFVDGDTLEQRNMERQNFGEFHPKNKALLTRDSIRTSLGQTIPFIQADTSYFTVESFPNLLTPPDEQENPNHLLVCAPDNHVCRKTVLEFSDATRIPCIIAGNDFSDGLAYIYFSEYRGTPLDPRVTYPELLTDTSNDPASCSNEAVVAAHPQLPVANFLAASAVIMLAKAFNREIISGKAPLPTKSTRIVFNNSFQHYPFAS